MLKTYLKQIQENLGCLCEVVYCHLFRGKITGQTTVARHSLNYHETVMISDEDAISVRGECSHQPVPQQKTEEGMAAPAIKGTLDLQMFPVMTDGTGAGTRASGQCLLRSSATCTPLPAYKTQQRRMDGVCDESALGDINPSMLNVRTLARRDLLI